MSRMKWEVMEPQPKKMVEVEGRRVKNVVWLVHRMQVASSKVHKKQKAEEKISDVACLIILEPRKSGDKGGRGKCPNSGRVLIQDTFFWQVRLDEETITQFFFYFF